MTFWMMLSIILLSMLMILLSILTVMSHLFRASNFVLRSLNLFHEVCFSLSMFLHSCGRTTRYSDTVYDFSATIPRFFKDFSVNSFFPHAARLWNSLSAKSFPLTYDLNGLMSRLYKQYLSLGSF